MLVNKSCLRVTLKNRWERKPSLIQYWESGHPPQPSAGRMLCCVSSGGPLQFMIVPFQRMLRGSTLYICVMSVVQQHRVTVFFLQSGILGSSSGIVAWTVLSAAGGSSVQVTSCNLYIGKRPLKQKLLS